MEKISKSEFKKKLRTDSSYFIETILGDTIWPKQKEIVQSVLDNERTTVKSCHASGKSWVAARIVLQFLFSYRGAVVITTAPTDKQVKLILWKEIRKAFKHSRVQLPGVILEGKLTIDDDWFAIGRSTNDPDNFQGIRGTHTLIVVDEASGVDREIFKGIEGILSTPNVKLLLIGNPTDPTGYFADTFKQEEYNKITISAFDTPNFRRIRGVDDLEQTRDLSKGHVSKHFISLKWAADRLHEWGVDSPFFQSRVLGNFPKVSDDTLIGLSDAEFATHNNDIELEGDRVLGVDVARFGKDRTAYIGRQGNRVFHIQTEIKRDTMHVAGSIIKMMKEHQFTKVGVDDTGVGGGVVDRLREQGVDVVPYNFGERSREPDKYANLKAEICWNARRMFENREIKIPDDPVLIGDITSMKYKMTSKGTIQIESKEDMKKRGLKSPDIADALFICLDVGKKHDDPFLQAMKERSVASPIEQLQGMEGTSLLDIIQ